MGWEVDDEQRLNVMYCVFSWDKTERDVLCVFREHSIGYDVLCVFREYISEFERSFLRAYTIIFLCKFVNADGMVTFTSFFFLLDGGG